MNNKNIGYGRMTGFNIERFKKFIIDKSDSYLESKIKSLYDMFENEKNRDYFKSANFWLLTSYYHQLELIRRKYC